ncbi:MAG: tRNA glutamyl-Q(34) synthetase GluQRS [Proteobacteria bacterium]|nr:tRNA glutamyl-Q(34) synthetase GluQRS [Pseudomonadota bacterium]MDA1356505.1 tRNA glutamyl-Q(34) synthetase GluQRS [Pseudomonadota bacterium]
MPPVTRFAPSPSGYLHLGHAYSALIAATAAEGPGGRFLLRIEDIDVARCRPQFEDAIREDLAWLGLAWEQPVRRQSEHLADYRKALETLEAEGLIYPCFCSRRDIRAEIARAGAAPHGPEGPIYPGTCRALSAAVRAERMAAGVPHALRLDMASAVAAAGALTWHEQGRGDIAADPAPLGDVVLARKDTPNSYHLAVTLDDHLQGVTLVTRGEDLFGATHIHRLLQALLGLDTPEYSHHALLRDASGRRFAKRDRALTLQELRAAGHTPDRLREMLDAPAELSAFLNAL